MFDFFMALLSLFLVLVFVLEWNFEYEEDDFYCWRVILVREIVDL